MTDVSMDADTRRAKKYWRDYEARKKNLPAEDQGEWLTEQLRDTHPKEIENTDLRGHSPRSALAARATLGVLPLAIGMNELALRYGRFSRREEDGL
ncbi:MAG TPA: hypothetical protein VEU32_21750 [Burkholderiales bacterium]|nr:hypothetical protein [Burkholderiales bacterium]